jgi:hypothetical protein
LIVWKYERYRMISSQRIVFFALMGFVACIGLTLALPMESTTVKILIPPPSTDSDEDDAVVIEAGKPDEPPKDETPEEFNSADCLLQKSKGPCRAVIDSWYYSTVTKACEPFAWSGCGGNNNRFSEKAFCETHCNKDKLTSVVSRNGTAESSTVVPILFPGTKNGTAKSCPEFEGCGLIKCAVIEDPDTGCQKCACSAPIGSVSGNPEAPKSIAKPLGRPEDVCNLPETRGDCRAMLTRWRYNPEIKQCVQFHFGGCDGNSNNFVSQEKCLAFCNGQ